eukprot:GHVQ01010323.1.p1 GENE.GHVQ01010323.1~~GHVQ01010323.1.p1  ORF type:complete len:272 (-),score=39.89 GHVQ01010323.1:817-1632(-)
MSPQPLPFSPSFATVLSTTNNLQRHQPLRFPSLRRTGTILCFVFLSLLHNPLGSLQPFLLFFFFPFSLHWTSRHLSIIAPSPQPTGPLMVANPKSYTDPPCLSCLTSCPVEIAADVSNSTPHTCFLQDTATTSVFSVSSNSVHLAEGNSIVSVCDTVTITLQLLLAATATTPSPTHKTFLSPHILHRPLLFVFRSSSHLTRRLHPHKIQSLLTLTPSSVTTQTQTSMPSPRRDRLLTRTPPHDPTSPLRRSSRLAVTEDVDEGGGGVAQFR